MTRRRYVDALAAVSYIAFVFAGVYKSAERLSWFPVDLTVFLGVVSVVLSGVLLLNGWIRITRPGLNATILFMAFTVYASLTGIWTPSTEYYVAKTLRLVVVTGLALGIGALVIAPSLRRLRYAALSTAGVSLLTAIETIYQYTQAGRNVELYPFGTNYLITGRAIGFGILLAVGYLVFSRSSRRVSLASIVGIGIGFYALLVGGGRGPMITTAGGVALLIAIGVLRGALPNGRTAVAGYGVVGVLGVIGLATFAAQLRGIWRIIALLNGPGSSLGTRFDYWVWSIENIDIGTVVQGHGLGSWPVLYGMGDLQQYPHNMILEVLFELGIIGLGLLSALLLYVTANTFFEWSRHRGPIPIVIGVLFVYMLMNTMVTGDLNENRFLFALVGLMTYRTYPTILWQGHLKWFDERRTNTSDPLQ